MGGDPGEDSELEAGEEVNTEAFSEGLYTERGSGRMNIVVVE